MRFAHPTGCNYATMLTFSVLSAFLYTLTIACIIPVAILALYLIRFIHASYQLRRHPGESWTQALNLSKHFQRHPHRSSRAKLWRARHYAGTGYTHREHTFLTPILVSSHPADIIHIMSSDQFERIPRLRNALAYGLSGSLFTMPAQSHHRARAIMRASFTARLLPRLHAPTAAALRELVAALRAVCDGGQSDSPTVSAAFPCSAPVVDIVPLLSVSTFRIATHAVFGTRMDAHTRRRFLQLLDGLLYEMAFHFIYFPVARFLRPLFPSVPAPPGARAKLDAICLDMLDRRLAARRCGSREEVRDNSGGEADTRAYAIDDLLDVIIEVHGYDGRDGSTDAISQAILFSLASTYTTRSTISWAVYELSRRANRDVQHAVSLEIDRVCNDLGIGREDGISVAAVQKLSFLRKVWKETLRLHPTTPGNEYRATRATVLKGSGTAVARGTHVVPAVWAAQTDGRNYRRPREFDPHRWGDATRASKADLAPNGAFVPFSVGPSNCAGQFFADFEGVITLAEVFRRFQLSLPCPDEHVVSHNGWFETPAYDPADDGSDAIGVPVIVTERLVRQPGENGGNDD